MIIIPVPLSNIRKINDDFPEFEVPAKNSVHS